MHLGEKIEVTRGDFRHVVAQVRAHCTKAAETIMAELNHCLPSKTPWQPLEYVILCIGYKRGGGVMNNSYNGA